MLILFSCSKEQLTLEELERIKMIGDDNPKKALAMLDSLKIGINLLQIRLNDKADNVPNSDIMIKKLISYFEENGSMLDKQEVYYYAGSVYRDLQDTPRSLECFLKSIEYAENENNCDSIMMRNAYSNLNDLYYKVQNYNDAVKMAQKELYLSLQLEKDAVLPYLHLGTAYRAQDELRCACEAFDAAYEELIKKKDASQREYYMTYLLYDYSILNEVKKAKNCFLMIEKKPSMGFPCMAFAQYYKLIGLNDSASVYCKYLLDNAADIYNMYDAAKLLFNIYNKVGDIKSAYQYASIYMQLSDSLDFGKRQELAATVNNEFQYHLDQKKEQALKDEKERYKNTLTFVVMAAILLASIAYIFYVRRRNKHLKEVLTLSAELQRVSNDERQLRKDIEQKEKDLEKSKKSLEKSSDELNNVKRELQRVNAELSDYDEALKAKEQQLSEKMNLKLNI